MRGMELYGKAVKLGCSSAQTNNPQHAGRKYAKRRDATRLKKMAKAIQFFTPKSYSFYSQVT